MREWLHLLLRETREVPALNPRPGADICHRVLALALASKVFPWLSCVFARQPDFEDAVNA